jgi:hypothetical protein
MKIDAMAGIGRSLERATAIVPATLLVLFAGLLWLIGLFCGKERRTYVMKISSQATATIRSVLSGAGQQTRDTAAAEQPESRLTHPRRRNSGRRR